MEQFNQRGNELTWNSDGIIFIDQISIPNSDMFVLFPYLFKHKHPKNLTGFEDFVEKINAMGLDHLILKRNSHAKSLNLTKTQQTKPDSNWWYIG